MDGVLNSVQSTMYHKRLQTTPANEALCPIACANLSFILDSCPDVDLVISSTWRHYHDIEWIKNHLSKNGIDGDRVRGVTPELRSATGGNYGMRGQEIDAFIQDWHSKGFDHITDFVIIDDNSDMDPHFEKLVQTDSTVGFDWKDVERVAARFKIIKLPIIGF